DVSHRRGDDHASEIPGDFKGACSHSHSHLSSPYCLALSLHRFVAGECTGPPSSECVLTRRNCSRTEVDRIATARLSTPALRVPAPERSQNPSLPRTH